MHHTTWLVINPFKLITVSIPYRYKLIFYRRLSINKVIRQLSSYYSQTRTCGVFIVIRTTKGVPNKKKINKPPGIKMKGRLLPQARNMPFCAQYAAQASMAGYLHKVGMPPTRMAADMNLSSKSQTL